MQVACSLLYSFPSSDKVIIYYFPMILRKTRGGVDLTSDVSWVSLSLVQNQNYQFGIVFALTGW